MLGIISPSDIESELRRRGIYTEVVITPTPTPFIPIVTPEITPETPIYTPPITPLLTPEITPIITPFLPEAPVTPVEVTPGPPPRYYEPVIPYVPPYITPLPVETPAEVPERELWLPGAPPTRAPEKKLSKSAIAVGAAILGAIILYTHGKGKPAKKKPALRRRVTTEVYRRPETTEAM